METLKVTVRNENPAGAKTGSYYAYDQYGRELAKGASPEEAERAGLEAGQKLWESEGR